MDNKIIKIIWSKQPINPQKVHIITFYITRFSIIKFGETESPVGNKFVSGT